MKPKTIEEKLEVEELCKLSVRQGSRCETYNYLVMQDRAEGTREHGKTPKLRESPKASPTTLIPKGMGGERGQ